MLRSCFEFCACSPTRYRIRNLREKQSPETAVSPFLSLECTRTLRRFGVFNYGQVSVTG